MKTSRIFAALLAMVTLLSMLAGCKSDSNPTTANNCEHEWLVATCKAPKTCRLCGKTEGAAYAHQWTEADCTHAKTCRFCNTTEGEVPGHQWAEGSCVAPKTCTVCNITEGTAPGHDWQPATPEAPKTCKVCGQTEGDRITLDPRFDPEVCKELYGIWTGTYTLDFAKLDMPGIAASVVMTLEFRADGMMISSSEFEDLEAITHDLTTFMTDMVYETFITMGMGTNREEIDLLFSQNYGTTVYDYMKQEASATLNSMISSVMHVYYAEDGVIYDAENWDQDMYSQEYELRDGKLFITNADQGTIELTYVGPTE